MWREEWSSPVETMSVTPMDSQKVCDILSDIVSNHEVLGIPSFPHAFTKIEFPAEKLASMGTRLGDTMPEYLARLMHMGEGSLGGNGGSSNSCTDDQVDYAEVVPWGTPVVLAIDSNGRVLLFSEEHGLFDLGEAGVPELGPGAGEWIATGVLTPTPHVERVVVIRDLLYARGVSLAEHTLRTRMTYARLLCASPSGSVGRRVLPIPAVPAAMCEIATYDNLVKGLVPVAQLGNSFIDHRLDPFSVPGVPTSQVFMPETAAYATAWWFMGQQVTFPARWVEFRTDRVSTPPPPPPPAPRADETPRMTFQKERPAPPPGPQAFDLHDPRLGDARVRFFRRGPNADVEYALMLKVHSTDVLGRRGNRYIAKTNQFDELTSYTEVAVCPTDGQVVWATRPCELDMISGRTSPVLERGTLKIKRFDREEIEDARMSLGFIAPEDQLEFEMPMEAYYRKPTHWCFLMPVDKLKMCGVMQDIVRLCLFCLFPKVVQEAMQVRQQQEHQADREKRTAETAELPPCDDDGDVIPLFMTKKVPAEEEDVFKWMQDQAGTLGQWARRVVASANKRDGAMSVDVYMELHWLDQELLTMVMNLGWTLGRPVKTRIDNVRRMKSSGVFLDCSCSDGLVAAPTTTTLQKQQHQQPEPGDLQSCLLAEPPSSDDPEWYTRLEHAILNAGPGVHVASNIWCAVPFLRWLQGMHPNLVCTIDSLENGTACAVASRRIVAVAVPPSVPIHRYRAYIFALLNAPYDCWNKRCVVLLARTPIQEFPSIFELHDAE